jgi:hypothetical protein
MTYSSTGSSILDEARAKRAEFRAKIYPQAKQRSWAGVAAKEAEFEKLIGPETIVEELPKFPFLPKEESSYSFFSGAVMIRHIQNVVAEHFDITVIDILSARREQKVTRPRMIAMYLCKILTTRSLPDIGRRFGNKDHTTVLHSVRKITYLLEGTIHPHHHPLGTGEPDMALAAQIEVLKGKLGLP